MSNQNIENRKSVIFTIKRIKVLKELIENSLKDVATESSGRFASYKSYAVNYNEIATQSETVLGLEKNTFIQYPIDIMPGSMDTTWIVQREIMESVLLSASTLLAYLECATEYADNEFDNLENFFADKLRRAIYQTPSKEIEVQNAVETLLVGKGMVKGLDYDREAGKLLFSGKEYIPDFIIPKLNLCIEVKLLREGRKSQMIEEINSDITAYSKKYGRILFIIYDLGVIRDESEFRRDIENVRNIKVIVIKH